MKHFKYKLKIWSVRDNNDLATDYCRNRAQVCGLVKRNDDQMGIQVIGPVEYSDDILWTDGERERDKTKWPGSDETVTHQMWSMVPDIQH